MIRPPVISSDFEEIAGISCVYKTALLLAYRGGGYRNFG